jgi:hypothetical protein
VSKAAAKGAVLVGCGSPKKTVIYFPWAMKLAKIIPDFGVKRLELIVRQLISLRQITNTIEQVLMGEAHLVCSGRRHGHFLNFSQ